MLNFLLELGINYLLFRSGGYSRSNPIFVVLITGIVLTLAAAAVMRGTS